MEEYKKQILAKDLCGRLAHNVVVCIGTTDAILKGIKFDDPCFGIKALVNVKTNSGSNTFGVGVENCKPYLRPMISMTPEEELEFRLLWSETYYILNGAHIAMANHNQIEWLNKHHFDYNNLIEKGLALKALEGMYSCVSNNANYVENNVYIEQQMCKSNYDLLDCALKYVRDRMPNPTWDSDEQLKKRGLALDAPWR